MSTRSSEQFADRIGSSSSDPASPDGGKNGRKCIVPQVRTFLAAVAENGAARTSLHTLTLAAKREPLPGLLLDAENAEDLMEQAWRLAQNLLAASMPNQTHTFTQTVVRELTQSLLLIQAQRGALLDLLVKCGGRQGLQFYLSGMAGVTAGSGEAGGEEEAADARDAEAWDSLSVEDWEGRGFQQTFPRHAENTASFSHVAEMFVSVAYLPQGRA